MKHRHRILVMLSLLSMITFLDRVCISVAGPRIQREFSISLEHWGWVVGAFSLAYSLFEIPTGMMGDRFGSRRVLTRIVLWWSAFTAFTGMVTGYGMLVAVRFLFGVGEAGAFPNISAVISRWFPPEERARSQGWVWTATRLGAALSPVLVVPITAVWGWRTTFWIFGSIGVVWAVVWHSWYRDSPAESPGISQAELQEIANRQLPATKRLSLGTAFKHPTLRAILLMYFCYCYAAYFFISWLHTYLVRARAFNDKDLAVLSTLPFLFGAAANLAGGVIGDHLVKKLGLTRGRRTGDPATGFGLCQFRFHASIGVGNLRRRRRQKFGCGLRRHEHSRPIRIAGFRGSLRIYCPRVRFLRCAPGGDRCHVADQRGAMASNRSDRYAAARFETRGDAPCLIPGTGT